MLRALLQVALVLLLVGAFRQPLRVATSRVQALFDARDSLIEELMSRCDAREDEFKVQEILKQLIPLNPTPDALFNWRARRDVVEKTNPLHGLWKLRFASDPSASINKLGRRGPASAMRFVNASEGTWTDIVEFPTHKGKVKGFKLVSSCSPPSTSSSSSSSSFSSSSSSGQLLQVRRQRLVVDRRSRIGLHTISLPLPPLPLLSLPSLPALPLAQAVSLSGPGLLRVLYLDEELCVYRSCAHGQEGEEEGEGEGEDEGEGEGKGGDQGDGSSRSDSGSGRGGRRGGHVFVQSRLYDVWDPAVGWRLVSAI